jgi:hypothetical protein
MPRGPRDLPSMQTQMFNASNLIFRQREKPVASNLDISELFSQFSALHDVIRIPTFG